MPKEIFPSSFECDCGHESDFSERTVTMAAFNVLVQWYSNNSPPPLIVTMTPLGYMAPRSKGTWYFPEVYGIIAKTVPCLSMHCNSLQYLHL